MDATAAIARFVVGTSVDASTRAAAASAMVDTVAVMVAGGVEASALAVTKSLNATVGDMTVPSLWSHLAYRPHDAALLYGTAAHALDYDDVSMLAICHPSAPVLAALLCARPWPSLTHSAICDALAIGTEVMIRVGQAIGYQHYEVGFHATATLGVLGAAAAVARIRGLDERTTRTAVAIAASLAGGLRGNFGSMTKPLHVGIAAANGVRAADWAAAGITATTHDIIADGGFLAAFSGGVVDRWPQSVTFGIPFAVLDPGLEQKRYPCCYLLHKIITAILDLRVRHDLVLASVAQVHVAMPRGGMRPLIHPRPATGQQAQFSGPYVVAAALEDGRIDFDSFTDLAVARPDIRDRLGDVVLEEAGDVPLSAEEIGAAPVTITVRLADGTILTSMRTASPGSSDDPLTKNELFAKWADCLRRAAPDLPIERCTALFEQADNLPVAWLDSVRHALTSTPSYIVSSS